MQPVTKPDIVAVSAGRFVIHASPLVQFESRSSVVRNAAPAALTLLLAGGPPAWPGLRDLAFTLGTEAAGLAGRLAPMTASAVGDLVRGMNCYYSNLIEGHETRPIDIERALRADFAAEPGRRDLQREATAHLSVPLGETERLFPHLLAPSALGGETDPAPDLRDVLQPPHSP